MKKLFQISLMAVVTIALVAGAIQFAVDTWIDVGWNSGVSSVPTQELQLAACKSCVQVDPEVTPYVGWNSKS
jgi:hypothetical protein